METPPTPKGQQTQTAVIEAAYQLFVEKGYHGTSMRLIAQKAGLALGSIYNHFANKEEIFKAVLLAHHPFVRALPRVQEAQGETAEQLLRHAAHLIIGEVMRDPNLLNMMFIELIELQGRHMMEIVPQIAPYMIKFLQRVASTGDDLRPLPLPILMRTFIGLLIAYFVTHVLFDGTVLPAVHAVTLDEFLDVYLQGLLNDRA